MASASGGLKSVEVNKVGTLNVDNGAADGTFVSTAIVTSSEETEQWKTGAITVTMALTGAWESGAKILDKDGHPWSSQTTAGGVSWTVTVVEPDDAPPSVVFTAVGVDVTGTAIITLPEATFTGTYRPGDITPTSPLGTSVTFTATNISVGDTKSLQHNGPRTEYTPIAFDRPEWTMDRAATHEQVITATSAIFTIGSPTNSNMPSGEGAKPWYFAFEGVRAETVAGDPPLMPEVQEIPAGVNNLKVTLAINPAWDGIDFVTAELWARVANTATPTDGNSIFPAVYLTSEGGTNHVTVYNLDGDFIVTSHPIEGTSVTLEIAYDPFTDKFGYYADGDLVYTENAKANTRYLDTVLLNHQNPNHPASPLYLGTARQDPEVEYAVVWSNLEFGERIDLGSYSS